MAHILVVDDEKTIRQALTEILEDESYEVSQASDGEEAWGLIEGTQFDAVLCDIKMPKMDGIELLDKVVEAGIDVPFIMISAHGTIETAVDATKKGAYDFIQKPPDLNRLLLTVRNALDKSTLQTETKRLKKKINKAFDIVGNSGGFGVPHVVDDHGLLERVGCEAFFVLLR